MYAIKTVNKVYLIFAIFVDTDAPYCKAEIIRGDDIDITMAERRILTLGTRTNFLTQLHSSFQVLKRKLII